MTTDTRPSFTPGPWKYDRDAWNGKPTEDGAGSIVSAPDDDADVTWIVAEVKGDVAEWKANAHLIAAAPEMYEALRRFEQILWESDKVSYDAEAWWNELAAPTLAKADGSAT